MNFQVIILWCIEVTCYLFHGDPLSALLEVHGKELVPPAELLAAFFAGFQYNSMSRASGVEMVAV